MIGIEIEIDFTGPLATGESLRVLREFLEHVRYQVGAQALAEAHLILDQKIKHPTPYYETQLNVRVERDVVIANDRGVIYGPWLEGTSSRNQTTRFKGYSAFRRATQRTRGKVLDIATPILNYYIGRM